MNWKKRRWIEITTVIGCNVNCEYCPQNLLVKKYPQSAPRQMPLEDFTRYLEKIPTEIDIHFSGYAEPFQNKECAEMILFAAKKHRVAVFTTLKGCNVSTLKKIENIDFLIFEIHLPSEPLLEHIDINENYLETLQYLIESKIDQKMHFRGSRLNKKIRLSGVNIAHKGLINRAENLPIENRHVLKNYVHNKNISCSRLQKNILLPSGDISLCCMDYGLRHILGNLNHVTFEELYSSNEFCLIKKSINDPSTKTLCSTCYNWHPKFNNNIYKYAYLIKNDRKRILNKFLNNFHNIYKK